MESESYIFWKILNIFSFSNKLKLGGNLALQVQLFEHYCLCHAHPVQPCKTQFLSIKAALPARLSISCSTFWFYLFIGTGNKARAWCSRQVLSPSLLQINCSLARAAWTPTTQLKWLLSKVLFPSATCSGISFYVFCGVFLHILQSSVIVNKILQISP
jgi:hypothetical protein